ncbi:MarR family winged helix-turn-helix transcriptional regulator [Xanthobacter agilis]|uniref:DNA-binding MarR family transcriptional regulator n=1 Tax=Xanthobacter agilis TaxID=47492 RepID=A0ABU0LEF2_XANAG|nr:MarR family transcriptional regulator [Xanthobacter agilis]MDQ0505518.1 DNA-binding MarR family transcriptional regulator [Xanthobacter agilis]
MTPTYDPFTHPASRVALEVFRLNGALIAAGDALVAPLGLTSARWQVLGAIAEAGGGLPTAGIARNMGLTRQSVQRVVDDLSAMDFVRFAPNPHHKRAKLVQLTPEGAMAFAAASACWAPVADALAAAISSPALEATAGVLRRLAETLAQQTEARHALAGWTTDPRAHPTEDTP